MSEFFAMIRFYWAPLKEALDFYKQLIFYGDYDPMRNTLPKASEVYSKAKPLYDMAQASLHRSQSKKIIKKIRNAEASGELSVQVFKRDINENIVKDLIASGYEVASAGKAFDFLEYLEIYEIRFTDKEITG